MNFIQASLLRIILFIPSIHKLKGVYELKVNEKSVDIVHVGSFEADVMQSIA